MNLLLVWAFCRIFEPLGAHESKSVSTPGLEWLVDRKWTDDGDPGAILHTTFNQQNLIFERPIWIIFLIRQWNLRKKSLTMNFLCYQGGGEDPHGVPDREETPEGAQGGGVYHQLHWRGFWETQGKNIHTHFLYLQALSMEWYNLHLILGNTQ